MTIPSDYLYADRDFRAFMERTKEMTELETTNMSWGVLLGVFEVFRRRLNARERLLFAAALPPTLRAVFMEKGAPGSDPVPFASEDQMAEEVCQVHRDHQFANETSIKDIAKALSEFVDPVRFGRALEEIGPEAVDFWKVAE